MAFDEKNPNLTLSKDYYTSADLFSEELEKIFYRNWIYAGCEADLPLAGDHVSIKIGERSIFLQRTETGKIKGFYNTCRHRGHEVVAKEKGNCKKLICPYHKWAYDLNGKLLNARGMDSTFPLNEYGLNEINVEVIGGLIYVCLNPSAPANISRVKEILSPYLAPYSLKDTKIAFQQDLIESCNWKLVIENNRECLHCVGTHHELMVPLHDEGFGKGLDNATAPGGGKFQTTLEAKEKEWEELGLPYRLQEFPDNLWFRTVRLPLANQCISHTLKPEHACKKLLGNFKKAEGSGLSLWTHPNSWNHFLYDHIVTFMVLPLAVDKTLVRTKWLVAKDAVEGVDYNLEELTYVWNRTNAQDQILVEGNYRGIRSGGYQPGPLSDEEYLVKQFLGWYKEQLAAN